MASGIARRITGAVVGTGSALDVESVGFEPRRVILHNVASGGLVTAEHTDTMPPASMVFRAANGAMTFPLTNGITLLPTGFRIGANADLNAAGETIHWIAEE